MGKKKTVSRHTLKREEEGRKKRLALEDYEILDTPPEIECPGDPERLYETTHAVFACLWRSNAQAAIAAIMHWQKELEAPEEELTSETSIVLLGMTVRTTNRLQRAGLHTIRDLLECKREDLLALSDFGSAGLEEVLNALRKHGWRAT
ncbi:MAG TPA: hypothetical protein DCE55_29260 [Planctomycetaceae bacterium]|nr:hypothetical protein [Planctomycetaceae bacterium]|tara:strand:- start:17086 stop:17529 length:444 start_codon:yes stop_codon:yes gene_type:complete